MEIRAFLAFDISDKVKKKLSQLVGDFSQKEKSVKWVKAENMHVTMKFFGSVDEDLLLGDVSKKIGEVTKGFGASVLKCEGIGVFPNWKYPKVVWTGFAGETEKVMHLQEKIEDALSSLDLHEDKREFRLHLTVGRTRGILKNSPLIGLVEKLGPVNFGEVKIDRLVLYKSVLTKSGPIYTPLKEFMLD